MMLRTRKVVPSSSSLSRIVQDGRLVRSQQQQQQLSSLSSKSSSTSSICNPDANIKNNEKYRQNTNNFHSKTTDDDGILLAPSLLNTTSPPIPIATMRIPNLSLSTTTPNAQLFQNDSSFQSISTKNTFENCDGHSNHDFLSIPIKKKNIAKPSSSQLKMSQQSHYSSLLLNHASIRQTSSGSLLYSTPFSTSNNIQMNYSLFHSQSTYNNNNPIRFFTTGGRNKIPSNPAIQKHSHTQPPPPPPENKNKIGTLMDKILFGIKASQQHNMPNREKWRTSDLLSVWGVAALFTTIVCMPFAYQHIKKADHKYDDFAMMPVDDIDQHITSIFLDELKEELLKNQHNMFNINILGEENDTENEGEEEKSGDDGTKTRKLVRNTVIDIAKEILNDDTLKNALSDLLTKVIQSNQVQKAIQKLIKELWFDLISDPQTKAQIVVLLQEVIQDEAIKKVVKDLMVGLIQDEDVYRELMELIKGLGDESEVRAATQALLTESTHQALNDPEILDHSMEFATDVVGDDVVQRTSGEALRNTVSYAVQPGLSITLSILGISLVALSFTALRNVRFTEREGAALNKAISDFGTRAGNIIAHFFSRLWSIPRKVLAPIGSVVSAIVMAPYEMVKGAVSAVGYVSGVVHQFIVGVVQAPVRLMESTTLAVRHVFVVIGRTYLNATDSVQMFGNSMAKSILSFVGNCKVCVLSTWQDLVTSAPVSLVGTAFTRVYNTGATWIFFLYSHFDGSAKDPR